MVNRMTAARDASRAAVILFTILFILSQFVLSTPSPLALDPRVRGDDRRQLR